MPEKNVRNFPDWSDSDLSAGILSGKKLTIERYVRELDQQPLIVNLVKLIHPSCQRIAKFRGRPIDGSDVPDLKYDLKSYGGICMDDEELKIFSSAMMSLETAYYGFAENMACHHEGLNGINRFYFEDWFKDRIGWIVWSRWKTEDNDCFFSLHKAIVNELTKTEYSARKRYVWGSLFHSSYDYLPEDQEYLEIGELTPTEKIRQGPKARIRQGLEKIPLTDIVTRIQSSSYFEQYCFFVALGYGIDDPDTTSFKRTFGIGDHSIEKAIDRTISSIVQGTENNSPDCCSRSFYQIVKEAKANALVYSPDGIRMPHTHARCKLIGKSQPENIGYKDKLVFELATARDGQTLVHSLDDISQISGISRIVVDRRIRTLAKLVK